MGLTLLQVLDSSTLFSMKFLRSDLQKLFAAQLAPYGLRGIFSGAGSLDPSWQSCGDLLIYQNLGLAMSPRRTLELIRYAAGRGHRFLNLYIFAWNITPGDLLRIVEHLDDSFCIVTPGHLLELIQQKMAHKEKGVS